MLLNVTSVVAGTIWNAGPPAVVLALLPIVFALVGLALGERSTHGVSEIQWIRYVGPAGAIPTSAPAAAASLPAELHIGPLVTQAVRRILRGR